MENERWSEIHREWEMNKNGTECKREKKCANQTQMMLCEWKAERMDR